MRLPLLLYFDPGSQFLAVRSGKTFGFQVTFLETIPMEIASILQTAPLAIPTKLTTLVYRTSQQVIFKN